jgi:hypothetical protein
MSKTAKTSSAKIVRRSPQSGQFLGVTKDGIRIPRPDFKPVSFTERQLNKVMRELREQPAKAG